MKLSFLIALFALCATPYSWANNAIATGGAPVVTDESAVNSLGVRDEDMKFIIDEDQAIQSAYDGCLQAEKQKTSGSDTLSSNVGDCLWGALDDGQKAEVAERIEKLTNSKGEEVSPVDDSVKSYEGLDTGFLSQAKKDPAFKAFQDHMVKKLKDTIYGEGERGKLNVADHTVFHELYKSQLANTVVQAMSSYCLDSKPTAEGINREGETIYSFFVADTANIKNQRKTNIDRLTLDPAGSKKQFNDCIGSLKDICYQKNKYVPLDCSPPSAPPGGTAPPAPSTWNCGSGIDATKSKNRACNVVTYIKQLKQNIIAMDKITDRIKELNDENQGVSLGAEGQQVKTYNGEKNALITNMSSKEAIEDSKFKEKAEEEAEKFKECLDPDTGGQVGDTELCEQYLNDNQGEAEKILAEATLRKKAEEFRIDQSLQDPTDEEAVNGHLKDQGYTDEEIEALKASVDVDKIAQQIKDRYKDERDAYIKSLSEKIKGKTIEEGADIANDVGVKGKLVAIQEELSSKTERYTELIHFNNIVSGFLQIEGGGQNTNAMSLELQGTAYNPQAAGTSGGGRNTASDYASNLEAAIEGTGTEIQFQENGTNTLKQKEINQILKYDEN